MLTVVRVKIVAENGELKVSPGYGECIPRLKRERNLIAGKNFLQGSPLIGCLIVFCLMRLKRTFCCAACREFRHFNSKNNLM